MSISPISPTSSHCIYWVSDHTADPPTVGHCHRFPPGVTVNPETGVIVQKFPTTERRQWCGEWSDDAEALAAAAKMPRPSFEAPMNVSNLLQRSDLPFLLACLMALHVFAFSSTPPAHGAEPGEASEISRGGKLYDNHWLVTGKQPPEQPNPLFPVGVKTTAANTWRCVSCHGWDYSGRAGELGDVSKSKTFHSLRPAAGRSPTTLIKLMQAPGHKDNLQGLTGGQIDTLAHFVSTGQFAFSAIIVGGKPVGDPLLGKDIFEGVCVSCHQADGKAYFQGEDGDRSSLGWVAHNRPAQALHKIMNGVPSADMLSLRFLPEKRLADLLAYLQTLDDKGGQ